MIQASKFFSGFHQAADQSGLASAWNEVQGGPPPPHLREMQPSLAEFDRIYDQMPVSQPILDGTSEFLLYSLRFWMVGIVCSSIAFYVAAEPFSFNYKD